MCPLSNYKNTVFFPYIGYWQVIHAVDLFIVADNAHFIQNSRIYHNHILGQGGQAQYFGIEIWSSLLKRFVSMTLYASEYEAYQIRTGREIVAAYPELYNPWTILDIKHKLELCAQSRPDIAGDRSIEDIFAVATPHSLSSPSDLECQWARETSAYGIHSSV